jgi:hypothetical protein
VTFFGAPVSGTLAQLFDAFHSTDSRSQFRTQEARIRCFISESSNGSELLIDGIRSQTSRFEVHAVPHDDDAIEGQARL